MKDLISLRNFLAMLLTGVFLVNCSPYPPNRPPMDPALIPAAEAVNPRGQMQTELERQAEENRKRLAAEEKSDPLRELLPKSPFEDESASQEAIEDAEVSGQSPVVEKKPSKYPTAVPTRKGFVKNPYTGNEVDVRGIPGGRLVVDPEDPNQLTNKFRVP
jgi:hypothetical protein